MARFHIRISTGRETALQTCLAADAAQAWEVAFDLAERLLGTTPGRHLISVRPAATTAGHQPQPIGEACHV